MPSIRWRSRKVTETLNPRCPGPPAARSTRRPELHDLLARAPITSVRLWDGSTPWLVSRYADQRALLGDPRVSADSHRPGYPHQSAGIAARRRRRSASSPWTTPNTRRLRQMVTAPFTIRRMEALRPAVQRIVDDLIDELLAGPQPGRPGRRVRAAGAVAGDLRAARRAVRRPRASSRTAAKVIIRATATPEEAVDRAPGLRRLPRPTWSATSWPTRRRPARPGWPRASRPAS